MMLSENSVTEQAFGQRPSIDIDVHKVTYFSSNIYEDHSI